MRKLIKDLAEVVNNLTTLRLLDSKSIDVRVGLDPKTHKYKIAVTVYSANQEVLALCLSFFQDLRRSDDHLMLVVENEPRSRRLTVEFYE